MRRVKNMMIAILITIMIMNSILIEASSHDNPKMQNPLILSAGLPRALLLIYYQIRITSLICSIMARISIAIPITNYVMRLRTLGNVR